MRREGDSQRKMKVSSYVSRFSLSGSGRFLLDFVVLVTMILESILVFECFATYFARKARRVVVMR